MAAARARLAAAGRRALSRWDGRAATGLLSRAVRLLREDVDLDVALELDLAEAPFFVGRGDDALERSAALAERGGSDRRLGRRAVREDRGGRLRLHLEPEGATEQLSALTDEALPLFEADGDDIALYNVYRAAGETPGTAPGWIGAAAHPRSSGPISSRRTACWRSSSTWATAAPEPTTPASSPGRGWTTLHPIAGMAPCAADRVTLAMLERFDEADAILAELDECGRPRRRSSSGT